MSKDFRKNARCVTIGNTDSDFQTDGIDFDKISDEVINQGKSRVMFMWDKKPYELWDWGLNEKVTVPTKKSSGSEIKQFIKFIETRKFGESHETFTYREIKWLRSLVMKDISEGHSIDRTKELLVLFDKLDKIHDDMGKRR